MCEKGKGASGVDRANVQGRQDQGRPERRPTRMSLQPKSFREILGLMMDDVAKELGLSPSMLSRLESGQRRFTLRRAEQWRAWAMKAIYEAQADGFMVDTRLVPTLEEIQTPPPRRYNRRGRNGPSRRR